MSEIRPTSPELNRPVLIADSDDSNVQHIERQLRRAELTNPVVQFSNGDDLLAFLGTAVEKPDPKPGVLFLDPKMPGANGYDPVRWLLREKSLSDVKVAIISAGSDPEETKSAAELGIDLFLKKHPDLGSLAPIIEHLRRSSGTTAPVDKGEHQSPPKANAA